MIFIVSLELEKDKNIHQNINQFIYQTFNMVPAFKDWQSNHYLLTMLHFFLKKHYFPPSAWQFEC